MKLSTEQLERLAERVYLVVKNSGHVEIETDAEEKAISQINFVLEDDSRAEERLSREAERLVQQQNEIAKSSSKPFENLVHEVKSRLAKSKQVVLSDSPEKADTLAEKVTKALWKLDGVDFYSEDRKVQNCIARAIHRFRQEDDHILDAVEKIATKKSGAEPYSQAWCLAFDKYYNEVLQRIARQKGENAPAEYGNRGASL